MIPPNEAKYRYITLYLNAVSANRLPVACTPLILRALTARPGDGSAAKMGTGCCVMLVLASVHELAHGHVAQLEASGADSELCTTCM